MTTQEQIAIMQAFVDGKQIEVRTTSNRPWEKTRSPNWNWLCCEYRIKPSPKWVPRTINDLPKGGPLWVRDVSTPNNMAHAQWVDRSGLILRECEFAPCGTLLFSEDLKNIEISADRETWLPWWKEVTNE